MIFEPFKYPGPILVESVKVPTDQELAAAIQRKLEAAKEFLGEKYLLHPSQQVQRKVA